MVTPTGATGASAHDHTAAPSADAPEGWIATPPEELPAQLRAAVERMRQNRRVLAGDDTAASDTSDDIVVLIDEASDLLGHPGEQTAGKGVNRRLQELLAAACMPAVVGTSEPALAARPGAERADATVYAETIGIGAYGEVVRETTPFTGTHCVVIARTEPVEPDGRTAGIVVDGPPPAGSEQRAYDTLEAWAEAAGRTVLNTTTFPAHDDPEAWSRLADEELRAVGTSRTGTWQLGDYGALTWSTVAVEYAPLRTTNPHHAGYDLVRGTTVVGRVWWENDDGELSYFVQLIVAGDGTLIQPHPLLAESTAGVEVYLQRMGFYLDGEALGEIADLAVEKVEVEGVVWRAADPTPVHALERYEGVLPDGSEAIVTRQESGWTWAIRGPGWLLDSSGFDTYASREDAMRAVLQPEQADPDRVISLGREPRRGLTFPPTSASHDQEPGR